MLWLLSLEMDTVIRVKFQYKAVWISYKANTFGKDVNLVIFFPAISKSYGLMGGLNLVWQPVFKEEN